MTARGNCVACGTSLDNTGFCWKCAGEGQTSPQRTQETPPAPSYEPYPKDIRALIHRALFLASRGERATAAIACRTLEAKLPGVGWANAAEEFELRPAKKAGPPSRAMLAGVDRVPF